jgi:hypothetical protein
LPPFEGEAVSLEFYGMPPILERNGMGYWFFNKFSSPCCSKIYKKHNTKRAKRA